MANVDFDPKKILREEEKPKLFFIGQDFYKKASACINEQEKDLKSYDSGSTKGRLLEDQLRSTKDNIKSIIIHRMRKIVREAQTAAFADEKNREVADAFTPEERDLYEVLFRSLAGWKEINLDSVVNAKIDKIATVAVPAPAAEVKPELTVPQKIIRQPVVSERAVKIEYIILRMLKSVPTFVGFDDRNYTLSKEDVVTVPAVNGKALVSRNAAVQIPNRKI